MHGLVRPIMGQPFEFMLEYFTYILIGITAGTLGGLLGIGGAIIVIPALVLITSFNGTYDGRTQHLIQAVGMICNFCVSLPAAYSHWQSGAVIKQLVKRMVPAALVGVLAGVFFSNQPVFAGDNGKYLSIILGCFLFYVACFNLFRLLGKRTPLEPDDCQLDSDKKVEVFASGGIVGLIAGLLGVGGGSICVPCQQVLLKVPLRSAIANSSCTILGIVLVGAIYKNATLAIHGIEVTQSFKLAACIAPSAMVASFFGSKLTHIVKQDYLRIVYVVFMFAVSILVIYKAAKA